MLEATPPSGPSSRRPVVLPPWTRLRAPPSTVTVRQLKPLPAWTAPVALERELCLLPAALSELWVEL